MGFEFESISYATESGASISTPELNVLEKVTASIIIRFNKALANKDLNLNGTKGGTPLYSIENNKISLVEGSFYDIPFIGGDVIRVYNPTTSTTHIEDRTIISMTPTSITFSGDPVPAKIEDVGMIISSKGNHKNFGFKWQLPKKGDKPTYLSPFGSSLNEYRVSGVGAGVIGSRSTDFVDMSYTGSYPSAKNGSAKIKFIDYSDDAERFQIDHTFYVLPFYVSGQLAALQAQTPPSIFSGTNTLDYAWAVELINTTSYTQLDGFKIDAVETSVNGMGWFNEQFNGLSRYFENQSITYKDADSGGACDALLLDRKTTVTCVVQKTGDANTQAHGLVVNFSILPVSSTYANKPDNFTDIWLDEHLYQTFTSATPVNGTMITNLVCSDHATDPTNLRVITFDIEFDSDQQTKAFASKNYHLSISFTDATDPNRKRNTELFDVDKFTTNVDIPDLIDMTTHDIYTQGMNTGVSGYTDIVAWNESSFLHKFTLGLDISNGAKVNFFKTYIGLYNDGTGDLKQWFGSQFMLDTQSAPISNNIQQIYYDGSRSYQRETTSEFNRILVSTGAPVANVVPYTFSVPHMITWQDYVQYGNVPDVFYTAAPDNFHNRNLKSSNYSGQNDYIFVLVTEAQVLLGDIVTDYRFISQELIIQDYNVDTPDPNDTTLVIKTYDVDNDQVDTIDTLDKTRIEATFTKNAGSFAGTEWAEVRLEEKNNGTLLNKFVISTVDTPSATSALQPLSGETMLKATFNAGELKLECLVDNSLLPDWDEATISAEWGASVVTTRTVTDKVTEAGAAKTTSNDITKIIE